MEGPPVVVIGGGLAGMAAAARLAKRGHRVELYEQTATLGGDWSPYELLDGLQVDDAPAVLGFPAPWRDLFRKSGRPLEAELARLGYALVPADPPRLIFADDFILILPTDRGEQYAAIRHAYGAGVASRWQDLLDRLEDVWQALRPLGFESELPARPRLPRTLRQRLLYRRTVAELAADLGHPHLTALLRSSAYRSGSTPENTPALVAVEHAITRIFGRWQLQPTSKPASDAGRSSVLVEALTGRLQLRKVTVRLATRVISIDIESGRATGIRTPNGRHPAAAVVCTADPWHVVDSLLTAEVAKMTRRTVHRLRPACGPAISHAVLNEAVPTVTETITHNAEGVPVITYRRPAGERSIRTVQDFGSTRPRPSFGVGWQGIRSFVHRPPVTTEIAGLFMAGPFSPAGAAPSALVLSGALAAYSCQDYLSSGSGVSRSEPPRS